MHEKGIHGMSSRQFCKPVFIDSNILTVPCIYMMKLLIYTNIHLLSFPHHFMLYEKSPKCVGTNLCNALNPNLKNIVIVKENKAKISLVINAVFTIIIITSQH